MEQAVMATKGEPAEREIVLVGPLGLRLGVAMNENDLALRWFDLGGHDGLLHFPALEPENLVDEDDGDPARRDLPVDDQNLVHAAMHAICRLRAGILQREGVLLDPMQAFLEVGHDLLRPSDQDYPPGA